jgi:hypothetical protein
MEVVNVSWIVVILSTLMNRKSNSYRIKTNYFLQSHDKCITVSQAPTFPPTGTAAASTQNVPVEAPTDAPIHPVTTIPMEAPKVSNAVQLSDHFISFVAPKAIRAPTREEYDEMIERIHNWFETAVSNEYNNNSTSSDPNFKFLELDLFNDFQMYGLNKSIPPRPESFNIYINFDYANYLFEDNNNGQDLPSPADLFKVIRRSITTNFILYVVRTYKGTPFESTNEVFLAALKR